MQLFPRHPLGGLKIRGLILREPKADARRQTERSVRPVHLQVNTDELPLVVAFQFSGDRLHADRRHFSSSIGGVAAPDGSGPGRAVERASRRPVRACALLATLALAGCEADAIAARATLADLGYHGIAIRPAPLFDRPCAWGEPFAVRFRAVTEDGRIVGGILCSADETARDARLLADTPEGRR
jgi:hypothetical protein